MATLQDRNRKRRFRILFGILTTIGTVVVSMNACSVFVVDPLLGVSSSSSSGGAKYQSASVEELKNSCAVQTDDVEAGPMRRLTTDEYKSTLYNILQCQYNCLGDFNPDLNNILNTLPLDVQHDGIATFVRFSNLDQTISPERLAVYHAAALKAAEYFTNNTDREFVITLLMDSCYQGGNTPSDDCVTKLVKGFALKAWRRPATDEQIALIRLAMANVTGFKAQLGQAVYYILMSPDFIYHMEVDGTRTGTVLKLDSYAVASKISYLLLGRNPDAELYTRAAAGKLQTSDEISAAVEYLRQTYPNELKNQFWKFTREWLNVSNTAFTTGAKAETFGLPNFSVTNQGGQTRADMNSELRSMFEYYVFDKPDSYKNLLTNQSSFARGPVVPSLYGVVEWDGVSAPPQHVPGQRAGFLTTASLLTSGGTTTHPFVTGGMVHKHVLCREFGDAPEPKGLPGLDSSTENMLISTRTRFEQLVPRTSSCMACHSSIEGVGMPFQAYDVFGRFRNGQERIVSEAGAEVGFVAVDSTQTALIGRAATPVANAFDLVNKFAATTEPQACFAKQYLRFANARKDGARDACTEYRFASKLQNGTVWDAIKSYVADDWFTKRRLE